jgi:hypothetical protein
VIIPLRPDVKVESDRRSIPPARRGAKTTQVDRGAPEQLSLFDERAER